MRLFYFGCWSLVGNTVPRIMELELDFFELNKSIFCILKDSDSMGNNNGPVFSHYSLFSLPQILFFIWLSVDEFKKEIFQEKYLYPDRTLSVISRSSVSRQSRSTNILEKVGTLSFKLTLRESSSQQIKQSLILNFI